MEKYLKLSIFIILIPTPDFPHFSYMLGGNLGSLLYGDVYVMIKANRERSSHSSHTPGDSISMFEYNRDGEKREE